MQFLKIFFIFCCLIFGSNKIINAQSYDSLVENGKNQFTQQKYEQAQQLFEQALQLEKTAEVHNFVGRCLLRRDKIEEAKSHFEKAVRLDDTYPNAYYNLGRYYEFKENFEKALEMFEKFSTLEPKDTDGWMGQARLHQLLNNTSKAGLSLDKAVETDTTNWKIYQARGEFRYSIKQMQSALLDINKALEYYAESDTLWLYSGQIKVELGDWETALADLNKALKLNPNYTEAKLEIATIYLYTQSPEKTIDICQAILEKEESNLPAMILLAYAYQEREEYQRSIDWAKKATTINPKDDKTLELLGKSYFFNKDYQQSEETFAKAIALAPREIAYYGFKVYARIYRNTKPSIFKTRRGLAFKNISSFQTEVLDKKVRSKKSPYFYSTLKEKFDENPEQMGLDEYFMFYYGYSSQKSYNPYGDDAGRRLQVEAMLGLIDEKKYEKCIRSGENFLRTYPFALRVYLYTAIAYFELGNYQKYEAYIGKYRSFISAILASGDGQSAETAYIVTSIIDEYIILDSLSFVRKSQSLVKVKGHTFDLLKSKIEGREEDKDIEVYFNIDKLFASFGK